MVSKRAMMHSKTHEFALRVAVAIYDLKSSHAYFTMQKAFGEIDWDEVVDILTDIINTCDCRLCERIKEEVIKRFNN